jgi:hypothetical protein
LKNGVWFVLILLLPFSAVCQKVVDENIENLVVSSEPGGPMTPDSMTVTGGKHTVKSFSPIPKLATRLAIIPGMGQLYNRDYWKVPLIYLSLGGGIYAYHLNNIKYNDFLKAYKTFYNADGTLKPDVTNYSTTMVRVRNLFNTSSDSLDLSKNIIEKQKNYWRRNKNLSIIVTGAIYALTIIEANVAAHMKTFDLSDDLSLRIEPKIGQPLMKQPTPGFRLVFNFK